MLTGLGVYTKAELESRYEITMENYCKCVSIEALTMVDMARRDILPAVETYAAKVAGTAAAKKAPVSSAVTASACGAASGSRGRSAPSPSDPCRSVLRK